jgi:hypothetical protein
MASDIYIYAKTSLGRGRDELEDDLDDFLGEGGEVTGGGSGLPGWNVDLTLADDADLESWVGKLVLFLREWGVPQDTYLRVFPPGWPREQKVREQRESEWISSRAI